MQKLHPRAVWLFFFRFLVVSIITTFFLTVYIFSLTTENALIVLNRLLVVLALVFLFCLFVSYILARLSYYFWRYELAENALKIEKGIIWKKYISIPYDRIQNVDIYRGVLARLLGLSDLQVQTAGYTGQQRRTEGRLPGLGPQVAEQLREELIQKVKATRQGL